MEFRLSYKTLSLLLMLTVLVMGSTHSDEVSKEIAIQPEIISPEVTPELEETKPLPSSVVTFVLTGQSFKFVMNK